MKEARTLTDGDSVLWTWTNKPQDPPSPGTVVGVNDRAVSIGWDDEDGPPSVFFFDDDLPWRKIEFAPEEPHYEPIAAVIPRHIKRRKARS